MAVELGWSILQEQVYTPQCAVLRGSNVSVIVVFSPETTGAETVREAVELMLLPSGSCHVRCAGLLVTAMQVRVRLVPATTGLSCETVILRVCFRSERKALL